MEKIYSVEEIQTIEKEEFKKLRNSYVLMKRAGTNCAKKIHISKLNCKFIILCDRSALLILLQQANRNSYVLMSSPS